MEKCSGHIEKMDGKSGELHTKTDFTCKKWWNTGENMCFCPDIPGRKYERYIYVFFVCRKNKSERVVCLHGLHKAGMSALCKITEERQFL